MTDTASPEIMSHPRRQARRRIGRFLAASAGVLAILAVIVTWSEWIRTAPRREAIEALIARHGWQNLRLRASNEDWKDVGWWERPALRRFGKERFVRTLGAWATFQDATISVDADDADAELYSHFPEMLYLTLKTQESGTLTNEACSHIAKMRALQVLYLESPDITDRGLASLAPLQNLDFLSIENARLTGSGFDAWPLGHRLQDLTLSHTKLNDDGLEAAALALPNLEYLVAYGCPLFRKVPWMNENPPPPVFPKLKGFSGGNPRTASTNIENLFLKAQPSLTTVLGSPWKPPPELPEQ